MKQESEIRKMLDAYENHMNKKTAMEIFGQLWEKYVECPKEELTKDAIHFRKQLVELVGG